MKARFNSFTVAVSIASLMVVSLYAETFTWDPKGDEPMFSLDVPADWETDYVVKGNGSVVFFREDEAVIEVRTFTAEDDLEFPQLMNLKAARLAGKYETVTLLSERISPYRTDLYTATWRLSLRGVTYQEKTAFISEGDQIVSMSCIVPVGYYNRYRTIFRNAVLSLRAGERKKKKMGILKLKELFLFNRPTNKNQIAPPASEKKDTKKKKKKKKASLWTVKTVYGT